MWSAQLPWKHSWLQRSKNHHQFCTCGITYLLGVCFISIQGVSWDFWSFCNIWHNLLFSSYSEVCCWWLAQGTCILHAMDLNCKFNSYILPVVHICHLLQAIESVSDPQDHRVIDVFVLFILYSIGGRKKTVETLFMNKIRANCFSDDLMNTVFGSHARVGYLV